VLALNSALACQITFIGLVLSLQRLFQGTDDKLSRLMHALVIAAVPVAIVNETLVLAAIELVGGAGDGLPAPERNSLVLALLNVHALGAVAGLFWGLWLFPFGLLTVGELAMVAWLLVKGVRESSQPAAGQGAGGVAP
jgi:hypothetical protein